MSNQTTVARPDRIVTMPTTIDDAATKRLTTFAADVTRLADERRDLELRKIADDLYVDLIRLEDDDDE